jgi:gas vesicle protein
MRSTVIFLAGVLAGALAGHVVLRLAPTSGAEAEVAVAPRLSAEDRRSEKSDAYQAPADVESNAPENNVAHSESVTALDLAEPDSEREWTALVGGMLEWEVERRTGEKLPSEKKDRLLSELARLREASLALQEAPSEPGDPADLRERLTQTLAMVQADQTFRKELGLGVSEFLQDLNSSAVEDVSAPAER